MMAAAMSHAPLTEQQRFAISKRFRKACERRNRERVVAELRAAGHRTWPELLDGTGLPPDELGRACDQLRIAGAVVLEDSGVYQLLGVGQ